MANLRVVNVGSLHSRLRSLPFLTVPKESIFDSPKRTRVLLQQKVSGVLSKELILMLLKPPTS
jgi:hypothetical protein